ncbi:MAG TPA: sodium/proline symporter [Candidatus Poseidoniales archaeon]|nr:MAG TPA: sodium/proline symporter [Candidatus Poseidoniales archaeon]DAC57534.1 MAG TPA: sodium/proline symporter [Candidatus Poseidoniales archaeon]
MLILFSFLLFMGIFAGVGIASMWVKTDTTDDYLVAGRGMHPALAALSAVSTWNSGYMFIGFIGFIFLQGYSAIWIALVSTIGQLVAWIWLYKYIQKEGNERNLRSLSSLVSSKSGAPEAKIAAVLSVFFLAIYAAAQLTAGGVALNSMLEWPEATGIMIGFVLVVAYCYAGGIRASIWTDAAQSCVMIIGSTILCLVALSKVGGLSGLHNELATIDSAMVNIYPSGLKFGATLWIAAFFLGGLGVAGQPQVVSRVMTLKDDKDRKQAMVWFFVWQTPFIALMFLIGLACRAIFDGTLAPEDAEEGLPLLAQSLNPILGGVILASIFAATMSTADSQVLACTAAITDDIKPEWNQDHGKTKGVTLVIAAFATGISLVGQLFPGFGDSVFALVVFAVYGLGGIFVPLILIRMMGYEPDSRHTISMMVAALLGVLIWTLLGFGEYVFPSVPGMGAAFAVHFAYCWKREESGSNPFGRYKMPTRQISVMGAAFLLTFVVAIEGSYLVSAPDGANNANRIGDYEVTGNLTYYEIASDNEYILDGEDTTIELNIGGPEEDGEFSMLNVVGVRATLTYADDEQAPAGCSSADDSVSGHLMYSDLQVTEEVISGQMFQLLWSNLSVLDTTVSNMSKSDIINMLENPDYLGFGDHSLQISVDVNKGDCIDPFRETSDDGEDVSYLWELITLDYSITMV